MPTNPPPALVPIEHMGAYLHTHRLRIVRHYLDRNNRLIVECIYETD